MLCINQLKLPVEHQAEELGKQIRRRLRLESEVSFTYEIARRSVDARKKPDIYYCYTVDVTVADMDSLAEQNLLKRLRDPQITLQKRMVYRFPYIGPGMMEEGSRPVIVGMGPAGLFCGYMLAVHGFRPIILERGDQVDQREKEVERFWNTGRLNPESNVQFGEGGAGTFSDGKLNTLIKDKDGRGKTVLSILIEGGAPEQILYDALPHMGTDRLKEAVVHMRRVILEHGGEIRFGAKVTGFLIQNGCITGVTVNETEKLAAGRVVLAIGHSARDTFQVLHDAKVPMEAKAFAVGLRVEHPQAMINRSRYGRTVHERLEAAAYKVAGRTSEPPVYSFCMCPGGYVVNASSEKGRTAVNGMSYSDRQGTNANSAVIAAVTPDWFGIGRGGSGNPLSGVSFQRELEERAFQIGQGKIPVEYYRDFKRQVMMEDGAETGRTEEEAESDAGMVPSDFLPAMKGKWCFAPVHEILPAVLNQALVQGMTEFGRMIRGFDHDHALLSGVESRTSSPVRILRDVNMQSTVRGLYPCGEGAGYAGGIMSAAMDGIRVAEAVAGAVMERQKERK